MIGLFGRLKEYEKASFVCACALQVTTFKLCYEIRRHRLLSPWQVSTSGYKKILINVPLRWVYKKLNSSISFPIQWKSQYSDSSQGNQNVTKMNYKKEKKKKKETYILFAIS